MDKHWDLEGLVDSHAHLSDKHFDDDRKQIIDELTQSQFKAVISVGDTVESSQACARLAKEIPFIYATAGVHPHYAETFSDNDLIVLREMWGYEKLCAIGEIGLDYYYGHKTKDIQRKVFRKQLSLALDLEAPVVVHNRDSDQDLLEDLESLKKSSWKGVIHCFDSNLEMALKCIDLGFYISFSGMLTFKKKEDLRLVAKELPKDRVLIETDCPYLAPHPYRGKKNRPEYVYLVAQELARLWEVQLSEVKEVTRKNALRLFNLNFDFK